MPDDVQLTLVEFKFVYNRLVVFYYFDCGVFRRKPALFGVFFQQMGERVHRLVHRAVAKVVISRIFHLCPAKSHFGKFADALVLAGGNRHDGHAEFFRQFFDVNAGAVQPHFVHHVERHDKRYLHFQQLYGQIQVAFEICGVDNVYYTVRFLVEYIVARDYFLNRIRRKRIYAGQIHNGDVFVAQKITALLLDRDARKVAYMLFAAGKLVKQSRLAAVLVANERDVHSITSASMRAASSLRMVRL